MKVIQGGYRRGAVPPVRWETQRVTESSASAGVWGEVVVPLPGTGVLAPHSASHSAAAPQEGAGRDPNASGRAWARAGAREGSAPAGGPHSGVPPVPPAFGAAAGQEAGPETATHSDHPSPHTGVRDGAAGARRAAARRVRLARRRTRRRMARAFTAPDIWAVDRPSLEAMWAYASRGEWTAPSGVFRVGGQAYACAAIPVTGCVYLLTWVLQRPRVLAVAWRPGQGWPERLAAIRAALALPDVWEASWPALRELWADAADPNRPGGWRGRVAVAYARAAAALTGLLYLLAWLIERPARLASTAGLGAALAQFPPLSWLI
jgi:hypothetical protein